jgi:hypothetical protein
MRREYELIEATEFEEGEAISFILTIKCREFGSGRDLERGAIMDMAMGAGERSGNDVGRLKVQVPSWHC